MHNEAKIGSCYKIGTRYKTSGKHPRECTVTDIHYTYNAGGKLVAIRYVSNHEFCGQKVTETDIVETTIARGFIE